MSEAMALDIVIDCLRGELAGRAPRLAARMDSAERDAAIMLARQNKVLSLVRERLVPAELAGLSFADAAKTLATNGALLKELGALAPLFRAAGIDFLAIKGPLQQQVFYGHAFQRSAADLDILVRPKQFARAAKALEAAGYV